MGWQPYFPILKDENGQIGLPPHFSYFVRLSFQAPLSHSNRSSFESMRRMRHAGFITPN
jgi:hypothetical protein